MIQPFSRQAAANEEPAATMVIKRASGLLLHITSLPGKYGSGTLGREADAFSDFLAASGQTYWQVLPLGPVCPHWNFSPYSSPSAFAGNELLSDPDKMNAQGWLSRAELHAGEDGSENDFADLAEAAARKTELLTKAFRAFAVQPAADTRNAFERFCREQRYWLDDYALFRALADHFQTMQWTAWPGDVARRRPDVLDHWRQKLAAAVHYWQFTQFVFFQQWLEMKNHANQRGLQIIGDIPFYVNFESADAWSHPEIFQLHEGSGLPAAVAGVPPDYFSATGQRWGNPLYRWQDQHQALNAATLGWWTARIGHLLKLVDRLRIDHFRGFETYWAIPAEEHTAVKGSWRPGPGPAFFEALKAKLGALPLIAEDLGEITPAVEALRDRLGLPGMKILQFAFDGQGGNPYLPHNFTSSNCLVYTGTHDNNTSNGWFYGQETSDQTKQYVLDYLNMAHRDEFHWQFIRLAMQSIACLAVFPVQDVLGYGERFRMNTPGQGAGNWNWKLTPGALTPELAQRLRKLTGLYGRLPKS
ncbi:MAG TPA: 4-alpha-glucanotransferase [Candidatus Binatia bacterium]|nr:4-alpha-glucanotransferase [Candidatus Binatia bacterium]